jgi:hypothetical protein
MIRIIARENGPLLVEVDGQVNAAAGTQRRSRSVQVYTEQLVSKRQRLL